MTSRIGSPDTEADIQVKACLDHEPPRSFLVIAGAGSGKTTSLIKALAHLGHTRGPGLRRSGQRIACITYTEVAVREISEDVGPSRLFHVSTIHSFLWLIAKPFQSDIGNWVQSRIQEKIEERQTHFDKPGTRDSTKERLRQEIDNLQAELEKAGCVVRFEYGSGSRYSEGVLGHDDVLKLAPALVQLHPLLQQVVSAQFPFIFVDESQDTNPDVVAALQAIAAENTNLCIGFFGDPMQQIYPGGSGAIVQREGWITINKPENFRCPKSVLDAINAIRAEGDGLVQTRGRMNIVDGQEQPVVGTCSVFVLPSGENRTTHLAAVRQWISEKTDDPLWMSDVRESDVRLLVLVHRMAATRLGFADLYASLHDKAPLGLSEGLSDGTAWPLRPFVQYVLPLVAAEREGRKFEVISYLREASPKLDPTRLSESDASLILSDLQEAVQVLVGMLSENSNATIAQVLKHIRSSELIRLDERFDAHLDDDPRDDGSSGFSSVQAFVACSIHSLWNYRRYLAEESPFATHHGVKGAQFERVLVVIDDEEAAYRQYSYGKYFGYTPLSDKDDENVAARLESVLDRTRRLFYVCCSRTTKDLAVVVFVSDVEAAKAAIEGKGFFPRESIHGIEALEVG